MTAAAPTASGRRDLALTRAHRGVARLNAEVSPIYELCIDRAAARAIYAGIVTSTTSSRVKVASVPMVTDAFGHQEIVILFSLQFTWHQMFRIQNVCLEVLGSMGRF